VSKGHLDAEVTVPTGGWAVSANTGGGATAVTVAAGTYTLASIMTAFQVALNAAFAEDFLVTSNISETTRTGYVTLDMVNAGNWTLNWTSTDFRDYLGFTGNLTGANSYTGTVTPQGLWIPDCEVSAYYGNSDSGHRVVMMTQTRSGTGIVKTIVESSFVEHPGFTWSHVSAPYARGDRETGGSVSFENWWYQTQTGLVYSYFPAGNGVAVFTNSSGNAVGSYKLLTDGTTRMDRTVPDWDYLFPITVRGVEY
jgi:hypothetical protein